MLFAKQHRLIDRETLQKFRLSMQSWLSKQKYVGYIVNMHTCLITTRHQIVEKWLLFNSDSRQLRIVVYFILWHRAPEKEDPKNIAFKVLEDISKSRFYSAMLWARHSGWLNYDAEIWTSIMEQKYGRSHMRKCKV